MCLQAGSACGVAWVASSLPLVVRRIHGLCALHGLRMSALCITDDNTDAYGIAWGGAGARPAARARGVPRRTVVESSAGPC